MNSKTSIKKSYEIDMCNGRLFPKILLFTLPLIASGILQILFNVADVIVVGRFAGNEALAAVGSTSSLTNMIINVFMGLSVGSNVMVARFFGGRNERAVNDAVHTSILISIIAGVILTIIGVVFARPLLLLMGTPEDVIEHSVLYMRIYFCGMPVLMLYNFGSSILRAVGDTRRPLYYLLFAGLINFGLNLVFVIVFGMGVAGVAIATVASQLISATLVLRCLVKSEGAIRLNLRKLRINKDILFQIMRVGLPAGIQGALFNLSNVVIQSSVNSFGSVIMAGNTAAQNVEGFVYTSMNSVHQAAVSFVGQNAGARKMDRVKKSIFECLAIVIFIGLFMGNMVVLFAPKLLTIFSTDMSVIESGVGRLNIICTTYCLCGIMDVLVGGLRGLGSAIVPTVISLIGACMLRIVYILTFFKWHRSLAMLYMTYPISWTITALAQMVFLIYLYRKTVRMVNYS